MEKEREMISKLKADMQPEKNNLPLHNNIRGEGLYDVLYISNDRCYDKIFSFV